MGASKRWHALYVWEGFGLEKPRDFTFGHTSWNLRYVSSLFSGALPCREALCNLRWVYGHLLPSCFSKFGHLNFYRNLRPRWIQRSIKLTLPSKSAPWICFSYFSNSPTSSFVSLSIAPDISSLYYWVSTWSGMGIAARYRIGLRSLRCLSPVGEGFSVEGSLVQNQNHAPRAGKGCFRTPSSL